jgi:hypothetical protein
MPRLVPISKGPDVYMAAYIREGLEGEIEEYTYIHARSEKEYYDILHELSP